MSNQDRAEGEYPARFACGGPEGTFWTNDSELANKLIRATFDRDDWTVTDMTNPTGATPQAPGADTPPTTEQAEAGDSSGVLVCAAHGIRFQKGCAMCEQDIDRMAANGPAEAGAMLPELPELPKCAGMIRKEFGDRVGGGGIESVNAYTADQMRAYAQAAIDAIARKGGEAVAVVTGEYRQLGQPPALTIACDQRLPDGTKLYTEPTRAQEGAEDVVGFVNAVGAVVWRPEYTPEPGTELFDRPVPAESSGGDAVAPLIADKGPWRVSDDGRYLQSEDFTVDARIEITGDFMDQYHRKDYAAWLATVLNSQPTRAAIASGGECGRG